MAANQFRYGPPRIVAFAGDESSRALVEAIAEGPFSITRDGETEHYWAKPEGDTVKLLPMERG